MPSNSKLCAIVYSAVRSPSSRFRPRGCTTSGPSPHHARPKLKNCAQFARPPFGRAAETTVNHGAVAVLRLTNLTKPEVFAKTRTLTPTKPNIFREFRSLLLRMSRAGSANQERAVATTQDNRTCHGHAPRDACYWFQTYATSALTGAPFAARETSTPAARSPRSAPNCAGPADEERRRQDSFPTFNHAKRINADKPSVRRPPAPWPFARTRQRV
jgi:hypothetical protein